MIKREPSDEEAHDILIEIHIGSKRNLSECHPLWREGSLTRVSASKYGRLGTCHNSRREIKVVRNAEQPRSDEWKLSGKSLGICGECMVCTLSSTRIVEERSILRTRRPDRRAAHSTCRLSYKECPFRFNSEIHVVLMKRLGLDNTTVSGLLDY